MNLKAPFPWFGNKSRAAHIVWERFGDVSVYVEPFAGSLAVLLSRPHETPGQEIINDADCYVANFWRAVQRDSAAVARFADWPLNEADLHARHGWLQDQAGFREAILTDPEFYDAKVAGWWTWGIAAFLGDGWMSTRSRQIPSLAHGAKGVHSIYQRQGWGGGKKEWTSIEGWMAALSSRLRAVHVACGDWKRVLGKSIVTPRTERRQQPVGIFLDPPYGSSANMQYATDTVNLTDVRNFAALHGENPDIRLALCGHPEDYDLPGWCQVEWEPSLGYRSQSGTRRREVAWFSPGCLKPPSLFAEPEPIRPSTDAEMALFGWQDQIGEEAVVRKGPDA